MIVNSLVTFVGLMITAYAPKAGVKYFGAFLIIAGGQANGPGRFLHLPRNRHKAYRCMYTSLPIVRSGTGQNALQAVHNICSDGCVFITPPPPHVTDTLLPDSFLPKTVSFGGVGGVIASTVFREDDYPAYFPGLWTTAALQLVAIVIIVLLDRHLQKLNKKADEDPQFLIENYPGFRYSR